MFEKNQKKTEIQKKPREDGFSEEGAGQWVLMLQRSRDQGWKTPLDLLPGGQGSMEHRAQIFLIDRTCPRSAVTDSPELGCGGW